jgi:hypothetical protein
LSKICFWICSDASNTNFPIRRPGAQPFFQGQGHSNVTWRHMVKIYFLFVQEISDSSMQPRMSSSYTQFWGGFCKS